MNKDKIPLKRLFFLDWVRVLAFAYLIIYHSGLMFVNWIFHITSGHNSEPLKWVMSLSHIWRLDLLFFVSGVAISFMVTKTTSWQFFKTRHIRLLLPVVFATIFIMGPQAYFEATQKGLIDKGFLDFWMQDYLSFAWWEDMSVPMPVYYQMWYVLYLFFYSIILIPFFIWVNSKHGQIICDRLNSFFKKSIHIIWLPLALFLFIETTLTAYPETHAVIDDWRSHANYISIVIIGVLMVRMPDVWQHIEDIRHRTLVMALLGYAVMLLSYFAGVKFIGAIDGPIILAWVKWSWILMLLGYARKFLSFDNKLLHQLNVAIYPVFIIHQTIIITIGYYIIQYDLPWWGEFVSIVMITFAISWGLYDYIIKRVPLMRPFFGLKS